MSLDQDNFIYLYWVHLSQKDSEIPFCDCKIVQFLMLTKALQDLLRIN